MSAERPRDIIDAIEKIAAEAGHFEAVDEDYYEAFLELTQPQIEKLAVAVMLDHEREVRRDTGRRSAAQPDPTMVGRPALGRRLGSFEAPSVGPEPVILRKIVVEPQPIDAA